MQVLTPQQQDEILDLLAKLVAIPSINRDFETANRERAEEKVAAFVIDHMQAMGMAVETRDFQPGRPTVIGHWPGQGDPAAGSVALSAHLDTVTVDDMTVDPFKLTVRDGRAYGRGSCDTKGSMAAFLTAMRIARENDTLPAEKMYFVAVAAEETGCQGSTALMKTDFRVDAAIVGEATRCQLVASHKGPLWLNIETHGRSCHASVPEHGVNAVEIMSRVVQFVHGPWQEYVRRIEHPLLGRSTMSVTTINGGVKINIIPSKCSAEIDSRLVPGEDVPTLVAEFRRRLTAYLGGEGLFTITREEMQPPLDCPPDAPLPRKLLSLCREANGQTAPVGVNYFADTGPFHQVGIQSVLFGPGDILQAHTADEYIELDQLFEATQIILSLLSQHAGRRLLGA